jgi:hypothetical protein
LRLVAQPFSVIPISRCQTATLVPAARFLRPGLATLLRSPESRGGRSAERRSGARRNTRAAYHDVIRQALARRLASHDAGRSPLGAPPWRFWAPGAALPSPSAPAALKRRAFAFGSVQRAPRTQVVVPGGRGPCLPGQAVTSRPPQDATPRSAFRIVSGDAPSMSEDANPVA